MPMNIHAKSGTVVIFTNTHGWLQDREHAAEFLTEGKEYIVEKVDIGGFSSSLKLVGIDKWFNTVMFEEKVTSVTTKQAVDFAAKAAQREHQFKTAFRSIELFNKLIGTEVSEKSVLNQLERVQEELTETFNAIAIDMNDVREVSDNKPEWYLLPYHTFEQKVELLDGVCDQLVVVIGLIAKMEQLGYDVFGALNEVCENNTSKFTKELIVAQYTQRHYEEELDTYCTIVYNEEHKLYGVRRLEDAKLLKPINYKPVNIEKYVPKEN